MAGNLFDRLNAGRPPLPATEGTEQEKNQAIERLLNWLINNWPRDTITACQISHWGPYPLRNETDTVLDLMQNLCARGWTQPIKPQRRDSRVWRIGNKSDIAKRSRAEQAANPD